MGKNRNKKGASASYKPSPALNNVSHKQITKQEVPKTHEVTKHGGHVPLKASKLLERANVQPGGDVFKTELKVTIDMFEAAKLMKGGVGHVKDLDMSVLKKTLHEDKSKCTYMGQVTLIDIFSGEVETVVVPLDQDYLNFDFDNDQLFSADQDSQALAKTAWDWLLNPIGIDRFKKEIKDKKIMILQNRSGFTYKQPDPQNDLLSLQVFRDFIQVETETAQQS